LCVCVCVCVCVKYIYIYINIHTYIYIYTHTYMWDRDGWMYEWRKPYFNGTTYGAHLNAAPCLRHLYSYRKSLWDTPLRFLYWCHGSSSVSIRKKRAQRSHSSSSHLSLTIWWHCRDCQFFTADLQRYDTTMCHVVLFYFYNLNIYFIVGEKLHTFIAMKEFLILVDYKVR